MTPWLFALLLPSAYAFDVRFIDGLHCAGNQVGKFYGSVKQVSGCQNAFSNGTGTPSTPVPHGGYNVRITPEGVDIDSGVAFYGQSDCETLIGFGNVKSCLGAGAYKSFKVINLAEADDQLQPMIDPPAYQSLTPNDKVVMKHGNKLGDQTMKNYSAPTSSAAPMMRRRQQERKRAANGRPVLSERSANPGRISHGDIVSANGIMYKYHQMSRRAFRGVPIHEWNKDLHKRNEAPTWENAAATLKRARVFEKRSPSPASDGTSLNPNTMLSPRAINNDKCYLVRTCMIRNQESVNLPIVEAGDDFLSAVAHHNPSANDFHFLRQPFAVELTNEADQTQGYIMAITKIHSDADFFPTCTDGKGAGGNGERGTLWDTMKEGVDGTSITDLRVDLKQGTGPTNTLFVSTRSAGNVDLRFRPICQSVEINY